MKKLFNLILLCFFVIAGIAQPRTITDFNKDWRFSLGNDSMALHKMYNDKSWRTLNLPHDWSIEGDFSDKHPTTANQAGLPAGIGWYRKTFTVPATSKNKRMYINFDGVYRNSEVWINGHYLGKRPNGYISFRYELTPYIVAGRSNVLSVKVDNSAQPNSRWYTGSGIYRKVWLLTTNQVAVDHWGTFVSTPEVNNRLAKVRVQTSLTSRGGNNANVNVETRIIDRAGKVVATKVSTGVAVSGSTTIDQEVVVSEPVLWSVTNPYLYKVKTLVRSGNTLLDEYDTNLGIRYFDFDPEKGFFLNGQALKILGVCNHHDLGALGAAVNTRAIERQLEILKSMGCNGIRTAHNPPASELLELCDKMGFIVMDEAFDMWQKRKNRQDYSVDFAEWHKRDLEDMIKRDRNHASIFVWSIGNEIREQFDSTGITITRELTKIIKDLDTTRPVTSALTENEPPKNFIWQSGALDLLGFNYKLAAYPELPKRFPGQKFIAAETMSALATRGHYDMPSDSNRLWPPDSKSPFATGNPDLTVSAYDHVYAYWGSSHEDGWNAVKKAPFMSGIYVWSGFDFLGEPVPYPWPARSSYYGIIDLAGFPKDVYYMYKSEWTNKPMVHLFPHWNWPAGKVVDVWAYYNQADEAELFLNNVSLGVKKKSGDTLHVKWRVPFQPGTLKVVTRKDGKVVMTQQRVTAGKPAAILLSADRTNIKSDGKDLSFVKATIVDANGNMVPDADNQVTFKIAGNGFIAGVDNGLQTSLEPFKASQRKAFNGLCLAIVQSNGKAGPVTLIAEAEGLKSSRVTISSK
ncbi:beta-galactosidase GalB [Segetibacter sp. 3557_3]|uniref:beta-galactosidase GalB n=1 Tax=Segetibacter sp. 3557_3 TaxID=2547429 RepID=UPI001FB5BE4D|nr:beta-galactosidase GalB [Segetibacter sp. 3557_3]